MEVNQPAPRVTVERVQVPFYAEPQTPNKFTLPLKAPDDSPSSQDFAVCTLDFVHNAKE